MGALGFLTATEIESDPIQQVSACFVAAGGEKDVYIELLEPDHGSSPISSFLEKGGGGLHHLCFEVDDIDAVAKTMVKEGFRMVCAPVECVGYDRAFERTCFQATRIAFFLVSDGLLIELLQQGR